MEVVGLGREGVPAGAVEMVGVKVAAVEELVGRGRVEGRRTIGSH